MDNEIKQREIVLKDLEIQDKIFRAYGILKNTRLLNYQEFMKLISYLRLGISASLIKDIDIKKINTLLIKAHPGVLLQSNNTLTSSYDMDSYRARLARELYL